MNCATVSGRCSHWAELSEVGSGREIRTPVLRGMSPVRYLRAPSRKYARWELETTFTRTKSPLHNQTVRPSMVRKVADSNRRNACALHAAMNTTAGLPELSGVAGQIHQTLPNEIGRRVVR